MYAITIDSVVYSPSFSTKKECKEYMKILRKKYPQFRGHEWAGSLTEVTTAV